MSVTLHSILVFSVLAPTCIPSLITAFWDHHITPLQGGVPPILLDVNGTPGVTPTARARAATSVVVQHLPPLPLPPSWCLCHLSHGYCHGSHWLSSGLISYLLLLPCTSCFAHPRLCPPHSYYLQTGQVLSLSCPQPSIGAPVSEQKPKSPWYPQGPMGSPSQQPSGLSAQPCTPPTPTGVHSHLLFPQPGILPPAVFVGFPLTSPRFCLQDTPSKRPSWDSIRS